MADYGYGICSPWATIEDVCGKCSDIMADNDAEPILSKAIDVASTTVFRLTRGIYTGECTKTIRPAKKSCDCSQGVDIRRYDWIDSFPYKVTARGGQIFNCNPCACFNDSISCGAAPCITLPYVPVAGIVEVIIDGEVLDSSAYQLRDNKVLCRTDGEEWPTCQDLDKELGDVGTWSVTFVHGIDPPEDLVYHTVQYACQLAKRCLNRPCELPERVLRDSNGHLEGLDPMSFVKEGLTGYAPLDACIISLNPTNTRTLPRLLNPAKRHRVASTVRPTWTPPGP
jgi:hypothetical protein